MPFLPFPLYSPLAPVVGADYQPPVLFDPVPGNIGLIGDSVILLHLEEIVGIMPSDAAGNLEDLANDADTAMPVSAVCWAGRGRRFRQSLSTALIGLDKAGRDTLLVREVTVQAIIAITTRDAAGPQTIVQRGNHDGTAGEAIAYGLELEATDDQIEVRWFWEDAAGVIHVQTGGTYTNPGDGQFVLLTATRRWESTGRVVIRYYAADQLLAEVISTDGDIAGGTTGHTMIGGRIEGGVWSNFLNADVDDLRVVDYEMSGDEVREVWRRLAVHQPNGVAMLAGLVPPGSRWYDNPGNNIGKIVKIAGEDLGLGIAKIEELRATWLPDAAGLDTIARWEKVCGLAPRPRDSLDVRRARVVAFLSRIRGYSLPALRQAFSVVVDQDEADVEILEFTNRIDDAFDTALAPERWFTGPDGTWSLAFGELKLAAAIGVDLRWEPTRAQCHVRTSISNAGRVSPLYGPGRAFITQVRLDVSSGIPEGTIVGLHVHHRGVPGDAIWLGAKRVGGVLKIGYQLMHAGVMGAFVTLLTPATDDFYWLRMKPGVGGGTTMLLGYSAVGPTTGFVDTPVVTGVAPQWAGVGATSDVVLAGALEAYFADFTLLSLNGDRVFHWYVYRDPLLPGTPDMVGAELLALKMRPGHTYAGVCMATSVLCDDARDGLCDRGPLGAL